MGSFGLPNLYTHSQTVTISSVGTFFFSFWFFHTFHSFLNWPHCWPNRNHPLRISLSLSLHSCCCCCCCWNFTQFLFSKIFCLFHWEGFFFCSCPKHFSKNATVVPGGQWFSLSLSPKNEKWTWKKNKNNVTDGKQNKKEGEELCWLCVWFKKRAGRCSIIIFFLNSSFLFLSGTPDVII